MKSLETIEEVEAYLGSQECNSTETLLTIWNAKMVLLLARRNQSLFEDTKPIRDISNIGQGIINMAQNDVKREKLRLLVHQLESYVTQIEKDKYHFNTQDYKLGTFYMIFAEMIILIETKQETFYRYIADYSDIGVDAESIKSSVKYHMKRKGQIRGK